MPTKYRKLVNQRLSKLPLGPMRSGDPAKPEDLNRFDRKAWDSYRRNAELEGRASNEDAKRQLFEEFKKSNHFRSQKPTIKRHTTRPGKPGRILPVITDPRRARDLEHFAGMILDGSLLSVPDRVIAFWDDAFVRDLVARLYPSRNSPQIDKRFFGRFRTQLLRRGPPSWTTIGCPDWFKWPSTDVYKAKLAMLVEFDDTRNIGLLSTFGYRVGKSEKIALERREILRTVFECHLSGELDQYLAEWDLPSSPGRLHKMANCLASFARNEKRKDTDSAKAISEWEADLTFLHDEYYVDHFHFDWPTSKAEAAPR